MYWNLIWCAALNLFGAISAESNMREMRLIRSDRTWKSPYRPQLYNKSNCKDPYYISLAPWVNRKLLLASDGKSDTSKLVAQGCIDSRPYHYSDIVMPYRPRMIAQEYMPNMAVDTTIPKWRYGSGAEDWWWQGIMRNVEFHGKNICFPAKWYVSGFEEKDVAYGCYEFQDGDSIGRWRTNWSKGLIKVATPVIDSAPYRLATRVQNPLAEGLDFGYGKVVFPEISEKQSWRIFPESSKKYDDIQDVFINSNCKELASVTDKVKIWSRLEVIYPEYADSIPFFPHSVAIDYCLISSPKKQRMKIRKRSRLSSYAQGDLMPFVMSMILLPIKTEDPSMSPNAIWERDLFPRRNGDSVCLEMGVVSDQPDGKLCPDTLIYSFDNVKCAAKVLCSKIGGKMAVFDDRFHVRLTSQVVK